MTGYRYVVVDVFTDEPLTGNQLAVFTDATGVPDELLQPLAREMAFSETAFVLRPVAEGDVRIRIFTPAVELRFAGHPVLGTAFVLGGPLQRAELAIETASGVIPVTLEREGARIVAGWMRQPRPTWAPYDRAAELLAALGVERPQLPVERYDLGVSHVLVALESEEAVAALEPDLAVLGRHPVGVSCFAGSGGGRWKTRMFAPGLGVAEDPATGSAAGPLALHLVRHGIVASGAEVTISQGRELSRPSTLRARAAYADGEVESVEVGGSAVVVARGRFEL